MNVLAAAALGAVVVFACVVVGASIGAAIVYVALILRDVRIEGKQW